MKTKTTSSIKSENKREIKTRKLGDLFSFQYDSTNDRVILLTVENESGVILYATSDDKIGAIWTKEIIKNAEGTFQAFDGTVELSS